MTFRRTLSLYALLLCFSTSAKIITVNTTNNVSPGPGETNLVQAIGLLADGDAIHFNIPGPGPFYLQTPPLASDNGYPPITNHNVTIDGYSQPGAVPNSNTILSSNNAQIKIVIDSRAGGGHVEDIVGFGDEECAALFVVGATNVTVRGLCFLGSGPGSETPADPLRYAIAFGSGADYGHVNGCRIGLALDDRTICPFKAGVAGFMGPNNTYINGTTIGVDKSAASTSVARSEFNIILGEKIPIVLEGNDYRICGNFLNIFPDGLTDYNMDGTNDQFESYLQIGRSGNNLLIGTDSDGNNDAEERNIFGGAHAPKDDALIELYNGTRTCTNMVFAGNYVGIGVDGQTRFRTIARFFTGLVPASTLRIGSDLDGFEDDLEGNTVFMNYPFQEVLTDPRHTNYTFCAIANPNASGASRVSMRKNRMVGNNNAPFSYAGINQAPRFTNIYTAFIQTNNLIPSIATNSTQNRLRGYCAVGKTTYTNISIDVYLADPEGWANGQLMQYPELAYIDPVTQSTAYRGFAQGQTYLGSFVENGPYDTDPTVGAFDFDISGLHVPAGALVTLTANYSPDAPGTKNARTLTTVFAYAHILQPGVRITRSGGSVRLAWPVDAGVYGIERSATLQNGSWSPIIPAPTLSEEGTDYVAYPALSNGPSYFRLVH